MTVVRLEDLDADGDGRRFSPSAARNRDAIRDVLAPLLPPRARVLEVASGTGEHALHVTSARPDLDWQPSDRDSEAVRSIEAWRALSGGKGMRAPLCLDVADKAQCRAIFGEGLFDAGPFLEGPRGAALFDAIVAINFFHITPWSCGEAFLDLAARLLEDGGFVFIYGAFFRDDVVTAQSNLDFDARLRAEDPSFGVRRLEVVTDVAARHGLALECCTAVPNNNYAVTLRRVSVTRGT